MEMVALYGITARDLFSLGWMSYSTSCVELVCDFDGVFIIPISLLYTEILGDSWNQHSTQFVQK